MLLNSDLRLKKAVKEKTFEGSGVKNEERVNVKDVDRVFSVCPQFCRKTTCHPCTFPPDQWISNCGPGSTGGMAAPPGGQDYRQCLNRPFNVYSLLSE